MGYRERLSLEGKVALVVGAASGIGRASAEALWEFGARVVAADLREEAMEGLAGVEKDRVDLRLREEVFRLVDRVLERHGRLDIAVTTPSLNLRKPLLDYREEEFDRIVELNLKGTFHFLQAAGKAMAAQGSGSLIAFSSIRALTVEPGQGVYAATKAGTLQMVRALAAELGPKGVRVNAVAPGVIDTPLTAPIKAEPAWHRAYAEKTALKRWGRPEEVAMAVVFLASEASSYITGTLFLVDGGWTAVDGRYEPPF